MWILLSINANEPNWSDIRSLKHLAVAIGCAALRFTSRDLISVKWLGLSLAFCNTCIKPQHWNTAGVMCVMLQMFG